MKISASIYSNNQTPLEELVRDLDAHGIDMLHVDCADNEKVFEDIARIRKVSSTPIDLHIISPEPEKYFQKIEELKIEFVSFQYENLKQIPVLPQSSFTRFGLSIVSATPIDVFEKAKDNFDFVMLMSTVPGQSGGEFNRESFQKVVDFKNRFPETRIQVDGGVNDEVAYILRLLGVHAIVSGSYLMNHQSLSAGMLSFHQSSKRHSRFKIGEFATPVKYLPVIRKTDLSFRAALETIEKFGLGFVLLTDDAGKLSGVITNADIRRGLLKHPGDLNKVYAADLVNAKPVFVHETSSVADMLRLLNELNFIVLFLPVTDQKNILKGAVLLNNLIRV